MMRKITFILFLTMIVSCLVSVPFAYGEEECGIGTAVCCVTETVTTEYAYTTEYRNDPDRYPESGNIVIQEGKNGSLTHIQRVIYEDGAVIGCEDMGEKYVAPVNEIISVPSKEHNVVTKEEEKTEIIYFTTKTVDDPSRIKGEPDQVVQEGRNGSKTVVYTVTYTDGVETGRVVKSESISVKPVEKIISVASGDYDITYETETVVIPFDTVYQDAPNWYSDEEEVTTEGQNGEKVITYAVRKDKSGNVVSRTVSSENVTKKAVNKVITRGTFVPVITYTVVQLPDLPECDPSKRNSDLDSDCIDWAMAMAQNNMIYHSDLGFGESVGGWGSVDSLVYGRDYTVISTHDGQTYNYTVSLGSHGGELLVLGEKWGAGAVKRTETQPGGTSVTVYFACARSEH